MTRQLTCKTITAILTRGNKVTIVQNSSMRRYPYNNWIINHTESSNNELIRNFVETQDEEAFNEIVNRYADIIYILALRFTRNPRDADEVLREVFLTMEKLNTFRGEATFSNWLHRVVANTSYKHLSSKKNRYVKEISLEDHASYNDSGSLEGIRIKDWSDIPDEILLSREELEIIERAVNEFPVAYRLVFLLRDVEFLTNHEVADILGLSPPADKSRIHRARLLLRDKLSGYFHEWKK